MCGIIGIIPSGENEIGLNTAGKMLSPLSHRGPDDKGVLEVSGKIIGQTRLSIIDIEGGHQPMKDSDKNISITFNGEIYNYKEIKKNLEDKGYIFKTNSDTEVIIKSYLEYGTDCLSHLNGMFAFIILDEDKKLAFMARDRFGKKPLYYAKDSEGNLFIASEIKSIFESGKILGEIDLEALDNYLALMYIPPWKTIYKNIETLAPAEFAVYKDGKMEKKIYWNLKHEPIKISYAEAKQKIKELFTEAVKGRLVADVEVGSFLSGGVDSTLVTAYAQKLSQNKIKTFSLGYGEYVNELPYAKLASEKIGTDHYTLQAGKDFFETLEDCIEYFDEPHADSSDFPQSILSEFASEKVKVALSGDGADELFMGYGWYQKHWNLSYLKHTIEKLFLNPFQGYLRNISVFKKDERKKIWGKNNKYVNDFCNKDLLKENIDPITKINLFDLTTYLPGQLLSKIDRMGMMHSLEVRSPFLDYKLAEFVYNLPNEFKMNQKENKIILKDILSEIMPKDFVNRRKLGFGAPIKDWLKEEPVKKYVKDKVLNENALIYKFLDKKYIKNIIENFYNKNKYELKYKIWSILCLEIWLEKHKKYHV